ncbi:hypothetical protein TSUD_376020 [Trifolium subterraneum]|uniref:Uncharacterized protein n=1 Tax=Trifolium subterraneum TaxID=3900 RepID=A0A2Z6N1U3_TRISU|nr:hypothetical protein TSUD_376020 [Trifolium subterraneum]
MVSRGMGFNYINMRWELENKVLAFFHFPPPHTGANLAEKLLCLLKEWGIERKIFSVTLDNASNNDAMGLGSVKKPLRGVGQPLIGVGQPLGGVGQRRPACNRCRAVLGSL